MSDFYPILVIYTAPSEDVAHYLVLPVQGGDKDYLLWLKAPLE